MKPRKAEAAMLREVVADLREVREAKKLPRKVLGHRLGYHWYTIGRWERGETVPSTPALLYWCKSLDVELRVCR